MNVTSLEKKSPSIALRLQTIKEILSHNINLRIHAGPFIPQVSDLEKILDLLPAGIKEMDVELYHPRQGNFKKILKIIRQNISATLAENLNQVYISQKNYETYTNGLKDKIKQLAEQLPVKFYCIIPDFNKFYQPDIDYEKTVKGESLRS